MSRAEVRCTPCGAEAKFTGPNAWQDMVAWDKAHRCAASQTSTGVDDLPTDRATGSSAQAGES